ncbi:MAG: DUF2937 family protein [Parachlamydiaceae bacterium]
MKIFSLIGNLFDRLFVVAGACIGSQIPQFMHQYIERLAGHVDALKKLINQLDQIAAGSNKHLDQYIQKFKESIDIDFNRQGDFLQGIVDRWQELNKTLEQMTQSPFWQRPYYFFKDFQADIAHSTFDSFQPGFNLTIEGGCYALVGMLIGWSFYQTIIQLFALGYSTIQSFFKK